MLHRLSGSPHSWTREQIGLGCLSLALALSLSPMASYLGSQLLRAAQSLSRALGHRRRQPHATIVEAEAAASAPSTSVASQQRRAPLEHDLPEHVSANVRGGLAGLIGNTPMLYLPHLSRQTGCTVLAKCEFLNPGGSPKDRVAREILADAQQRGLLQQGGTVFEGTAGSTGISLALLCRALGYKCVIVMPDDIAAEKEEALKCFGATVKRVKAVSIVNANHYCKVAERDAAATPGGFFADQFENEANFRAHYTTTGPEIWRQTQGKVDAFVMGAGTGGTISGAGRFLTEQNPNVRVCLIDPPGSSLFMRVKAGVAFTPEQRESHLRRNRYDTIAEGIGIDRITHNFALGQDVISDAYRGSDQEMVEMAHYLLRTEGLFLGSSSAMNCVGVVKLARELGPNHTIVTCLCDSGARYKSKLYNEHFLKDKGLLPTHTGDDLSFVQ